MEGCFHIMYDVAKLWYRTYNRPVERSGDGKPSVESMGVSDWNKSNKEAGNEKRTWCVCHWHQGLPSLEEVGVVGGKQRVYGYDSPKNVNNDSVSPSHPGFARGFRGGGSDLVTPLKRRDS
ncbi:hypothetical protein Tco_1019392 [Tanacetum coccineum]|uniref:Uncharacterized protein n=1 Tax=Tanacetum coccineum TaxID=301880 RepID=A0ABQ5FZD2_9ASTR